MTPASRQSMRRKRIKKLVAHGYRRQQIARELGLTLNQLNAVQYYQAPRNEHERQLRREGWSMRKIRKVFG